MPEGFRLFYTTMDFDGRFTPELEKLAGRPIAHCHQVHGCDVTRVPPLQSAECKVLSAESRPPESHSALGTQHSALVTCDALWTEEPLALAIKVADCIPLSLIDEKNHVIANVHSGWRGTVQNIAAATLDVVPLDPKSTTAWIGPSIRVCCFEVGEEVAGQFDARYVHRDRGPKAHVDTAAVVADVLRGRGIERVIDTGLCTRCEGSIFHSYRRDKRGGRNLAIVAQ